MTRVLVTGADGIIGRAVSERLLAQGYQVTALSLSYSGAHPADRVLEGDATSVDDVARALDGADALAHFAAIPHPSLGTPYDVFRVNTDSTFNVLSQAGERGMGRAVIASSINAIGYPNNPHNVLPPSFPLDESTVPDIADAYSLSKLVDERTAALAHRRWGVDVIALRFPLVKWPHVLDEVRAEISGDPGRMVREGWSYLTMADAARAVQCALESDARGAQVIALSARDTLLDTPTDELLRRWAPQVPVTRPLVGRQSLVDTSRARALLGFEAAESIHDGSATPSPAALPTS
ncbi:NAD-dependent epimerase/dehydratase family protein [Herbiconiux sp. A18JL235]|uniref:NAD-dependent epimerase/dehydratase family protein n=1 Tax=Herbiconiux sp. A18JL235 TaxID=3152363 RepID=A0AB39BHA6_9MICO